ncbi:MAG: biotin--[acetyl-CoA-carboxylase] ligase [Planctomycetota bacterium]
MIEPPLNEWADRLARPGRPSVRVYRSIGSTQDAARRLAGEDGAVVLADEQAAGRGRLGRRWSAPAETALLLSRVTHAADERRGIVGLAAAMAIADAVEPELGRAVSFKWPNDICVDGRKLAGVLAESVATAHGSATVLGIGLNVATTAEQFPGELRDRATSLRMLGVGVDRLSLAADLLDALDARLAQDADPAPMLDAWRQRCVTLDRDGRFAIDGREIAGRVIDLDASAGLIVRTTHGTIAHLPADITTCLD